MLFSELDEFLKAIPPQPSSTLDPFLDALVRCIKRHGLSHTSVQDVADEMGLSRVTVYRRVGTVNQQLWLLHAREVHRFILGLTTRAWPTSGPDQVTELVAAIIEYAQAHPVIKKVLTDEPGMVAQLLLAVDINWLHERCQQGLVPVLTAAEHAGVIAERDWPATVEWLFRLVASFIMLPPKSDLRTTLNAVIRPLLTPARPTTPTARAASHATPEADAPASDLTTINRKQDPNLPSG